MKSKVLQILKEEEGYISGEEISRALGVSRTAVWKVISSLKKEGYVIESSTNKGYYLKETPDLLTKEEVSYNLKTKYLGKDIYHYYQIDSTNKEAKKMAVNGAKEGTIIISEEQTLGKGRLGRGWISPPRLGIWMSIILRPLVSPLDASKITILGGLSVCKAIEKVTGLDVKIKWPNDIVINKKKVCGILTEMSAEMEKIDYIILGIGVNVNNENFPEDLKDKASSLKIEGNKKYNRKEIVQEIIMQFEKYYEIFIRDKNLNKFLEEYKDYCLTLNKDVKINSNKESFVGKAIDISEEGELIVQKEDGEIITVFSGEVSVRGLYGYI
ncbi:biotin--[acetyl-CoA-carboxylase] ligase [Defluviitalea phaphyphila]|uniref:biotin--[acetyl-CoA-carboxylase] ligase n=1 Tax=Defluviitalea phaphyphila TaxID=1473580 RepID=UPI000731BDA9|nr:biotin--[acetyl-CoA-carboxylase] ligase [Defluviitalea phaphyphila]